MGELHGSNVEGGGVQGASGVFALWTIPGTSCIPEIALDFRLVSVCCSHLCKISNRCV